MHALKIVVLAISLLLSQASVAVHDIHCLDGEHDQTCEVYATQDHSAAKTDDKKQGEPLLTSEGLVTFAPLVSPNLFVPTYLSRAPPSKVRAE